MTKRDVVWSSVLEFILGEVDPDQYDFPKEWDKEGMFCHHHIRTISDELDRSSKRTISRTLNEMVSLGWLERYDQHRYYDGDEKWVDPMPVMYFPSKRFENHAAINPNQSVLDEYKD